MAKKTLEKKPELVFAWASATPEQKQAHAARRRVLAAILGWANKSKQAAKPQPLKGESGDDYERRLYNYAKAIACRSFGYKSEQWTGAYGSTNEHELKRLFNTITIARLNNIYAEWCKKSNECKNIDEVVAELTINPN